MSGNTIIVSLLLLLETLLHFLLNTDAYISDGQRSGLSSLSPLFNVLITSALSTPGYGILPSEKISQQVTP